MARLARVIAVDTPHHITQRGNDRQFVFDSDSDRTVYLQFLLHYCGLHRVTLAGYCLMPNHVHLIATPQRPTSLSLALKHVHGRYAAYFNARHSRSGHVWQGRYYSCPLDTPHLWAALRYTEMNPVRGGLVVAPQDYQWSTAAFHCGLREAPDGLDLSVWRQAWTPSDWYGYLGAPAGDDEVAEIRRSTHTGRPLGESNFVEGLEASLRRKLTPNLGGRPRKELLDSGQTALGLQTGSG